MKTLIALAILALPLAAQTFPDQVVYAGGQYDQASTPVASGFVGYAKLTKQDIGLYSYTMIRETSITFKKQPQVQTQTETGFCLYTFSFSAFKVFSCGTGGISTAGGNAGFSASGTVLATKSIGRGWFIGGSGGPSYSGATGKTTYPVGLLLGWGQ